ncbi:MAG: RNA 3'-terminal phosphate cyclase, partial [Thermoprotei archaeon]
MLEIDGSYGEGGGQLLRYSVALAALLRKSVRIFNIRAKRSNPGLRPQHLNAVKTIVELVNGDVQGLKIG